MSKIHETLYGNPWAIKPEVLEGLTIAVAKQMHGESLSEEERKALGSAALNREKKPATAGAVAVIPIHGIIVKELGIWEEYFGGYVSTSDIQRQIQAAIANPKISQIILDVDSPGGTVPGVAELGDFIYENRSKKPISAYANGMAASAAYWIASAAEKVYATKTTEVGSIGVYTVLMDLSVRAHNLGIKFEMIKAGKNKGAGFAGKALADEDRAIFQERIDDVMSLFKEAVARNRGLDADETDAVAQGRVWSAQKALKNGLIDDIRVLENDFPGDYSPAGSASAAAVVKEVTQENITGEQAAPGLHEAPGAGSAAAAHEHQQEESAMTIDEIKAKHPELAASLILEGKTAGIEEGKKIGKAEGVTEERKRATDVLKLGQTFPGMAKEAVLAVESGEDVKAAEDRFKTKRIKNLEAGAPKTTGAGDDVEEQVTEEAAAGHEDKDGKGHREKARAYAKQNKCSMIEALRATAPKKKRQAVAA